jgi:arylsulfatase A-like enzyme
VTSDHGEEFGEHGVYLHGNSLYDRSLHVPLVIVPPQMTDAHRSDAWVPLRDVPATILALTGNTDGEFPGRALVTSTASASSDATPDTLVASVSRRPGVLASYPAAKGRIIAVMADQWKYIRYGDGREEVFDLRADRDERHDRLTTAPPDIVRDLRARASAADKTGAE